MRRSLLILLVAALASTGVIGLTCTLARYVWAQYLVPAGDDLVWLRREFRLSDEDFQRIRSLHEGYLPRCGEFCERIAARKQELHAALAGGGGVTPAVEQKLQEVGVLRAQCQAEMLQHFHEVSQAMPPEQGRRYLAEMQRLTLGSHEQFEGVMSGNQTRPHGHR